MQGNLIESSLINCTKQDVVGMSTHFFLFSQTIATQHVLQISPPRWMLLGVEMRQQWPHTM